MSPTSAKDEINKALDNLEPNKVIPLSGDAGKLLLEIVQKMKDKGEL